MSSDENENNGRFVRLETENAGTSEEAPQKRDKKRKKGIVYVSGIPKYMNVAILKEFLGEFGKIGRVYLQNNRRDGDDVPKKKQKYRTYNEGWVEFESKKVAKLLSQRLNGKPITTRKRSKFCDILWNLKYLSRFKWAHLSERLTYEKAVYTQRLQAEISMARKEATFYGENLDRSEKMRKKKVK